MPRRPELVFVCMETFMIRALQLILSLSILVFVHELGHFFFARLFKVRVEKFYLFFNPRFSLVRAKKVRGRWQVRFFAKNVPLNERPKVDADGDTVLNANGDAVYEPIPVEELADDDWRKYPETTEWGIGWIPLGGYCKIAGMMDESMDTTQLNQPPRPWEYRSRPAWQRLPIICGGVLFNFIAAVVIYIGLLYANGKDYFPLDNARYGLEYTQLMLDNGFENGDKMIAIDGLPVTDRAAVAEALLVDGKREVTVVRCENETVKILLPSDFTQQVLAAGNDILFEIRQPFVVYDVLQDTPADRAGLQPGDSITGINGKELFIFQDIAAELALSKNTTATVDFVRHGQPMDARVSLGEDGKLGVSVFPFTAFMPVEHIQYTFWQSIPAGIQYGWETLTGYVKQFKLVFTKEGAKSLGGFGTIGQLFPKMWDWTIFWYMTAFLSVILAFMNILPIPALDGGHIVFLLYEMIARREPSQKFMEYAQMVGIFILIALVLYANGNDLLKLFK